MGPDPIRSGRTLLNLIIYHCWMDRSVPMSLALFLLLLLLYINGFASAAFLLLVHDWSSPEHSILVQYVLQHTLTLTLC